MIWPDVCWIGEDWACGCGWVGAKDGLETGWVGVGASDGEVTAGADDCTVDDCVCGVCGVCGVCIGCGCIGGVGGSGEYGWD